MLCHYFKDGAELEVLFTDGVEVTINVSHLQYPDTYKTYTFVADKEMKFSELRERAWRLMKGGGVLSNPLDVVFERGTIDTIDNTDIFDWVEDRPIGNYMTGLG